MCRLVVFVHIALVLAFLQVQSLVDFQVKMKAVKGGLLAAKKAQVALGAMDQAEGVVDQENHTQVEGEMDREVEEG